MEGASGQELIDAMNDAIGSNEWAQQRVLIGVDRASEQTYGKIVINDETAELTENVVVHEGTAQDAEFADYMHADFIGSLGADPDASTYQVGQWYFHIFEERPRVVADLDPITAGEQLGFQDATFGEVIASDPEYIGKYANDEAAKPHTEAVGDLYFDSTNESLKTTTSITAGSGPTYGLRFKRILTSKDLDPIYNEFETVEENTTQIGNLRRAVADNEGRITAVETKATTNETRSLQNGRDLATAILRIQGNEDDISTNETNIQDNSNSVGELNRRLDRIANIDILPNAWNRGSEAARALSVRFHQHLDFRASNFAKIRLVLAGSTLAAQDLASDQFIYSFPINATQARHTLSLIHI